MVKNFTVLGLAFNENVELKLKVQTEWLHIKL